MMPTFFAKTRRRHSVARGGSARYPSARLIEFVADAHAADDGARAANATSERQVACWRAHRTAIANSAGVVLLICQAAHAQILPVPEHGGDLDTRPKLTGDWGGTRDRWAKNGFHVGLDTTLTFQSIADGGFDKGDGLVGSSRLLLQLDTDRAGLWPGGLVTVAAEGRYGSGIDGDTGALSPPNADSILPSVADHEGDDVLAVTEFSVLQFLSPSVGVIFGLLDTTAGDANELAGSLQANDRFLNTSFRVSPVSFRTTPAVTLGAGIVFLPAEGIEGSLIVLQSEESSGENPFDSDDGITLSTEWKFAHELSGLPGAQTVGLLYGFDRDYNRVGLDRRSALATLLPGAVPQTKDSSWAFYYSGHQYVQHDDTGRGWGVFGRFGVSDGDVNLVKWNVAAGIGGRGIVASRPNDTFGIGLYHVSLEQGALTRLLDVGDETGFEAWYNVAVAPWMHVTADLQVIDTAVGQPFAALQPILGPGGVLPRPIGLSAASSDTAWIVGLRVDIQF